MLALLRQRRIDLQGAASAAVLILPIFLFYGRAIADILVTATGLLFLLHSALSKNWSWTRRRWVLFAAIFYLLQLAASVFTGPMHSVLQALAVIRLFLFVAALEAWVLPEAGVQRILRLVFLVLAAWVAVEVWQQWATGANLFGYGRWPDGALTGPFEKPRAGAILVSLAIPALFPMLIRSLQRANLRSSVLAAIGLVLTLATMVLIGQRMPTLLMVLAMTLMGVLAPRLRLPLLVAAVLVVLGVLALPVISPPAYDKMVVRFAQQMSHFPDSPYGQLYVRAAVMVGLNPLLGLGFDGFRTLCSNPLYFHSLPALGIVNTDIGAAACNIHPHNYYFEAAVMSGLTGLAAFVAMVVLWARRIANALRPSTDPEQAMLAVAFVTVVWPIASTSSLFTFDTTGWAMLIIGWALAASARVAEPAGQGPGSRPLPP